MKKILTISLLLLYHGCILSQSNFVFQHLNTTNGLSYLGVNSMCADEEGNLWIGTGNGLNMFNGKTTKKFFSSTYPQLQNNNITQIICDSNNRIWVLTFGGHVSVLDKNRQFHKVSIFDARGQAVRIIRLLTGRSGSACLYTGNGNYVFDNSSIEDKDSIASSRFKFLPLTGYRELKLTGRNQVFDYDDHYYLLVHQDAFIAIDHDNNMVTKKYEVPDCRALVKWDGNGLLVFDQRSGKLKTIDLSTGEIRLPFENRKDQFGRNIEGFFLAGQRISKTRYLLTTESSGVYIYDIAKGKLNNYRHSFSDPSSIASDHSHIISQGKKGWVFLSTVPNGLSYFNQDDVVSNQIIFTDGRGRGYDGYVSGIATRDHTTYYLGIAGGMIEWNRQTNMSRFVDFKGTDGASLYGGKELYSIAIDGTGKIWATVPENGVVVLDHNLKLLKHIAFDTLHKMGLWVQRPSRIKPGPDGYMWVCGRHGISRIDPVTYRVDNFENTPLAKFRSLHTVPILFTDPDNLWIAASFDGLFHYSLSSKELTEVDAFKPFKKDGILDIAADSSGNIYVGNRAGLFIFSGNGRVRILTESDGLLINRAEGLLSDEHNRIWIGNDIGLACYDPADSSLKTFDVRYGLSIYGFRVGSYFRTPNGEFVLGTPKGLQYFHPDSLYHKKVNLDISVTRIETKRVVSAVNGNQSFRLRAGDNYISFYFGSVDFSQHLRTFYQYKLLGLDKDWLHLSDQNSVRYNSLPPGNYVFKVRVSNDNKTWQDAANEVMISVAAPFYQSSWFKLITLVIGSLLIWYVVKYYQRKQQKQREELETELVINYFASQINSRYKTDELLWDVAKNLIGKLGFEECMIYVWNDEKTELVQRAGYGTKGSMQTIKDRAGYNIPRGKGIVGAAVDSKQNLLVNDTSKDKRYFTVDEKIMMSELCVPLIHDNEVLGAINIEQHQKNFFTQKHLKMLSTIAVLCANQIQRIRAEEEKQQARIEALQNRQKATETRLQSLRLQMNPHFLFNALNSIQQMILANEEMIATKYLSKFSKLLRTILIYSDKEFVTLREELEILDLYIELESIRFKDSFKYKIECDEAIDTDEIKLPTLLIQPFVENAIWHGLMHKEGDRALQIKFREAGDCLHCTIEDNGVGRERSREAKLATGQGKKHTSKGIQVSKERLEAMNNGGPCKGSVQIFDLKDETGKASGTKVQIIFPTQNN